MEMDNAANDPDDKPAADQPEATPTASPPGAADEPTPAPTAEAPAQELASAGVTAGLDIGSQTVEAATRMPHTIRGKIEADGTAVSTGRRKTAVARVRVKKGTGKIVINDRSFEDYFPVERYRLMIEAPLRATGVFGQVDIWVRATGGGVN